MTTVPNHSSEERNDGKWLQRMITWAGLAGVMSVENQPENEMPNLCPKAKAQLNGEAVTVLVDSGSEVSLISKELYLKVQDKVQHLPKASIKLVAADGGQFPVLRTVQGTLRLKGSDKRAVTLHVVDSLNQDDYCLLGADFMSQNGVKLDMENRKLKLGKPRLAPTPVNQVKMVNKVALKPMKETVIPGKATGYRPGDEVLVEATRLPHGVIALDGVCKVDGQGRVGVHVVNTGTEPVYARSQELGAVCTSMENVETMEMEKKLEARLIAPRTKETDRYVDANADLAKLPCQWRGPFRELLRRFQDVFSRGHLDVGDCPVLPHVIKLTDPSKVVNIPPYRVPYHLMAVQHSNVDDLLAAKVIRPSDSPWSSPIMMVRKANADPNLPLTSQYRMVHNYKKVNELIKPSSYPLTNLYQLIDEVASKNVYSVLDLSQGYFNQRCEDPNGATAFNVPGKGTFIYARTPMGVNSSPAAFQRLTEYILKGVKGAHVYLDDIIVATDTYGEHLRVVEEVLQRLRKYNLKINLRKAHFGHEETQYLGYKITRKGISPGDRKVQAIRDAAPPQSVTQVRSFLGLCSFFRKTVPRFSEIAAPLNKLTRQDSEYKGGFLPAAALEAFRTLQRTLTSNPTIAPVDFNKEFIVTVDTSGDAHGAILSQKHGDRERVNAYASCLLPEAKKRRPAFQLEKEGIRWALKHFRPYLLGKSFCIRTDHKPLLSLANGTVDVLDNISADIQTYLPFRVEYLPGKSMPADFLSRPVRATTKIRQAGGDLDEKPPIGQVTYGRGQIKLTALTLKQAQCADPRLKALACYFKFKALPQNTLLLHHVLAYRRTYKIGPLGLIQDYMGRIVIPPALREEIMIRSHDEMGHRSTMSSLSNATRFYTWEGMGLDFHNYIKSCKVCSQAKSPFTYHNTKVGSFEPTTGFNQRVHLDCITGLRKSPTSGNTAILTITDSFSNYCQAEAISAPAAEEIMRCFLDRWCKHHGFPAQIVTDGGKEFTSLGFKEICSNLQIHHTVTSPGVSRQNGKAERANRSLITFLRAYINDFKFKIQDWELLLPSFCLTHNLSRMESGFSPHYLVYGLEPNLNHLTPLTDVRRYTGSSWEQRLKMMHDARVAVNEYKKKRSAANARYQNKKVHIQEWKPGSLVYLKVGHDYGSKLNRKYVGPLIILKTTNSQCYVRVLREHSRAFWVHKDRLKLGFDRGSVLTLPEKPNDQYDQESPFGQLDSILENASRPPNGSDSEQSSPAGTDAETEDDDAQGAVGGGVDDDEEFYDAEDPIGSTERFMTDIRDPFHEDPPSDTDQEDEPTLEFDPQTGAAKFTGSPATDHQTKGAIHKTYFPTSRKLPDERRKTPPSQLLFKPKVELTPLAKNIVTRAKSAASNLPLFEQQDDPEKILRKARKKKQ